MVGSVVSTAAVLLVASCGGSESGESAASRTVSGYGLEITIPSGWTGRVYRPTPADAIVLQVASFDLGSPSDLVEGADLSPNDVYLEIDDLGDPPERLAKDIAWDVDPSLPITVHRDDVDGPYEGGFPAGAGFGVVVAERALQVRARFGPSSVDLDVLNDILGTLVVAPAEPR